MNTTTFWMVTQAIIRLQSHPRTKKKTPSHVPSKHMHADACSLVYAMLRSSFNKMYDEHFQRHCRAVSRNFHGWFFHLWIFFWCLSISFRSHPHSTQRKAVSSELGKCHFMVKRGIVLGHISIDGIEVHKENLSLSQLSHLLSPLKTSIPFWVMPIFIAISSKILSDCKSRNSSSFSGCSFPL